MKKSNVKFVIQKGTIYALDGDLHHLSAPRIAELYGIRPYEWVEYGRGLSRSHYTIHLTGRSDGNYSLPEEIDAQIRYKYIPDALNKQKREIEDMNLWGRLKFFLTSKLG